LVRRGLAVNFVFLMASSSPSLKALSKVYSKRLLHTCLEVGLEIFHFETNRVPAARRELGFAVVQRIKQQTGLKLVGYVRTAETVDKTLDSHFFRGKSNGCHYVPPERRDGLGSLAVLPIDPSRFRRQHASATIRKRTT